MPVTLGTEFTGDGVEAVWVECGGGSQRTVASVNTRNGAKGANHPLEAVRVGHSFEAGLFGFQSEN